jgi:integrase/recombinase XerD
MARQRIKRGHPRVLTLATPGPDPEGMDTRVAEHIEWMRERNYSPDTVRDRMYSLSYFERWCAERGITRPSEVTKPIVERYQRWLFLYRKRGGAPLSFVTQHDRISAVQAFFKYLARNNLILSNPASDLERPKVPQRLPRNVLGVSEVERVLAQPDVGEPMGIRDRAILETFYSTGIRRKELSRLAIFDLDTERGTVLIREGKWRKDRMVPIGERALAWIEKYLSEVRSSFVVEPDPGNIFLGQFGEPLAPGWLTSRVSQYIHKAGLNKQGGCHLFRHTMATLMLEGGADVRFIQEMLGHATLQSTQIYTRVSIKKLKEIHTVTHPGARLLRQESAEASAEDHDEAADPASRDELLAALAVEASEEAGD